MERHQLRAQTWWNTPEQHTHTTHDLHQVSFAAVKFHYAENQLTIDCIDKIYYS